MSKTFAVISGNLVTNIIVAEKISDAELVTFSKCIELTDNNYAGIGDTYDEVLDEFVAPYVKPGLPVQELVEVPELAPVESTTAE